MLDAGVLGRWLDANDVPAAGEEPALKPLSGGSQNTLYLVERGGERMVLRMPGARADAPGSTACGARSGWCGPCPAPMCRMPR